MYGGGIPDVPAGGCSPGVPGGGGSPNVPGGASPASLPASQLEIDGENLDPEVLMSSVEDCTYNSP